MTIQPRPADLPPLEAEHNALKAKIKELEQHIARLKDRHNVER